MSQPDAGATHPTPTAAGGTDLFPGKAPMATSAPHSHANTARGALLLLLCLALEGCIGCCTPSVYHGPASSLDVLITIMDLDEDPGDGSVPIAVQFLYTGNPVQIDKGISITCNGIAMPWRPTFNCYLERIPRQAAKDVYEFVYTDRGIKSTVRATVPERPRFSTPTAAGATLPRSSQFTIRYAAGGGTSLIGRASDATKSVSSSQIDDGTHDGLDVSGFAAGPGKLSITRTLEWTVPAIGFQSATITYDTNTTIAIIWS